MKPLYLRLKAFGPFANEVDVSFDRVFDGGLFLIHGRTGAGKTSLLDGLCFSLFGRPSSDEREKEIRGLRSDLADAQTMTETELIFTIGAETYRVHRVPAQMTPKKRGEGLTEFKGSAELSKLKSPFIELRERVAAGHAPDLSKFAWEPLAGKIDAVDLAIENLLGMNERQFRQVVVLPQGKFREFLSSTSSDRQVILEKLFQTDRFSRLQQFISLRARNSETRLRDAGQALQSKLDAVGIAKVEDIALRESELRAKSEEVNSALEKTRARAEELNRELHQARELERNQERFRFLSREAELIENRKSEISALKMRAAIARRWLPYFHIEEQFSSLDKKIQVRQLTKQNTILALEDVGQKIKESEAAFNLLLAKKPSPDDVATELTRLRTVATSLKEIDKLNSVLSLDMHKVANLRTQIEALEARTVALKVERITAVSALTRIDERERGAESTLLETDDLRIKNLELGFHHSEASRLAQLLSPGAPCPVCGSLQHPFPATAGKNSDEPRITEDVIKTAKAQLEKQRHVITEKRARRQSRLEPLLPLLKTAVHASTISPTMDFDRQHEIFEGANRALLASAQTIEVQRAEIRTREESIATTRESIEQKRESIPEKDGGYDDVVKRGTELKNELETRTSEMKRYEAALAKLRGDHSHLNGSLQALLKELHDLEGELSLTRENRDALRAKIESEIGKTGSTDAMTPTRLDPAEIEKFEREIETFNELVVKNSAAVAEVQKSLEFAKVSRSTDIIATEFEAMTNSRGELEQSSARLRVEVETLTKLKLETSSLGDQLNALRTEAKRSARMSALLTGDRSQNKLLVPLSRFVLQSRFEEVLEQANRRLSRMSRGQFQLRRPALSRNLRDSQGLDIRVEDSNAGTERHAGSLSGGESFMAALSLALGLADVVQADLGGVKLDSVLIDEGFGTLDSESLDLAMKTLVDLQAGGRIVGIISHVQELKTQVSNRLEVKKSAIGSEVFWNVSN